MKKKVMVVDDSSFVYEDMKRILRDSEFEVVGYCVRGENALVAYESMKPDVVTMDIVLPGMDGFEASEQLLQKHPDAHIVIVSSLAYDETEEKAQELGIQAFVFKPFEASDILRALRFATGEKMDTAGVPTKADEEAASAPQRDTVEEDAGFKVGLDQEFKEDQDEGYE